MKKYILKNKWWLLGYLTLALISTGMSVYLSILLGDIIDVALGFNLTGFWDLIMFSAIFFVSSSVVNYIMNLMHNIFNAKVMRQIREDVFAGIMKQDIEQFESVNSADYISALTNDMQILGGNYFNAIAGVVENGMMLIIAIGFMIYLNWIIAITVLGTVAILITLQSLFGPLMRKQQTKLSENLSSFTIRIKDIFSGFEVIKSYQMRNHSQKVFNEHNNKVINSNFSLAHIGYIAGVVASMSHLFLQVGIVVFASYFVIGGRMYPGAMIAILFLSGQISSPARAFGYFFPLIKSCKEIIERLEGFINVKTASNGTKIAIFENAIKVKNLDFTYPNVEDATLKQVNFNFKKNKKYALIGKSGCGKTTLAKVLIGYLNGYDGNVHYDGVDIRKLTDDSFGKVSAMVHQNVYMFDEDIESNIGLHQSYKTTQLQKAVADSGVDLFLNEERTLQSSVGENGSSLSGGQRQRIAVARALIQNKPLLILDEGTSAVDRQTGADIENRLLKREDLTLITITHSLDEEMLRQYDEIVYMEGGTIIEHGSFDDLVKQGGKFSNYLSA